MPSLRHLETARARILMRQYVNNKFSKHSPIGISSCVIVYYIILRHGFFSLKISVSWKTLCTIVYTNYFKVEK